MDMTSTTTGSVPVQGNNLHDSEYALFQARLSGKLMLASDSGPLFQTDAENLFEVYLNAFETPEERQHHNCNACRRFLENYGGLVTIAADGTTTPAIMGEDIAPDDQAAAFAAVARAVRRAKVVGPFLSKETFWGQMVVGGWRHLAVLAPAAIKYTGRVLTAGQTMAEKREDYKNVQRALAEFTAPMLDQALGLLETDALYRAEKVIGPAKWLRQLHAARDAAQGDRKKNVVWLAIAKAPVGFCHPRSSMVGTLLEDIAAGMDFDEVSRRFAAKMHPLAYQRPQAAPTAGAIEAAEKLVEKLGIAPSLPRRFARLDELLETVWNPRPATKPVETGTGVFAHLQPKGAPAINTIEAPPQTMTWVKFEKTVLPTAEEIEIYLPRGALQLSSLVTAVDPLAPPILQWDREEKRNPFSWYFWASGSTAEDFSLKSQEFHKVTAVTLQPSMWGENTDAFAHQGKGVMFVVDGAKDTKQVAGCLFPETMKAELHAARSVIEAYSREARLAGKEEASAAGILVKTNSRWDITLRVSTGGRTAQYRLDRWD